MTEKLKPHYEILVKHTPFFEKWQKERYISREDDGIVAAIWGAYKNIEPNAKDPFGCPGCVRDMLFYANINRVTYMEKFKEPTKMTFPKHKKK